MLIVHYPHYQRIAIYKPIETEDQHIQHIQHIQNNTKIIYTHFSPPFSQLKIDPQLSPYIPMLLPYLPECPIFLQVGPTCGLNALKSILPELDIFDLLQQARNMGITEMGEIYCVHDLAKLAQVNGIESIVVSVDQIDEYKDYNYKCILVPFDVDENGIAFREGKNAHWGIVWKRFIEDDMVIITHSSSPYYLIERWSTLLASNKQLKESTVRINDEWIHQIDNRCLSGYMILI